MVHLGETIRWENQFQDFPKKGETAGSYITPSSHDISLLDPDGIEVFSSTSPDAATDADGHPYNYVDIPIDDGWDEGNFKLVWKATHGSNTWVTAREFAVEAP